MHMRTLGNTYAFGSANSVHAQEAHDVVLVSMRRHHVASTSIRRHFNVVCPLDVCMHKRVCVMT